MYLSCLMIDIGENPDRQRPGRLWLRNMYHVHQRLCMAFPSDPRKTDDPDFLKPYRPDDFSQGHVHASRNADAGFLFRIDPCSGGRTMVLVQSAIKPDWDYAFHNAFHFLAAPPQVKPLEFNFKNGQSLPFRLLANPTRKIDTKSGPDGIRRNGKRVPILPEKFYEWLAQRAEPAGFSVNKDSTTVQPGYVYFQKERHKELQRLRSVRFEGLLRITDAEAFRETLMNGIGSAKAFGFGLLSVAPASQESMMP